MFDSILTTFANLLSSYGVWSAGIPSGHGMYEEKVPQKLIKLKRV